MPARKRPIGLAPFNTAECRAKIKASQLIHRLQAHIFDGLKLEMSQIKAIDILLKKIIPDLTRTEIAADLNVRYVAELPKVLTREEWVLKYGTDHLTPRTIEGTVIGGENGKANGSTDGPAPDKILQ
jgi:hypothetical protein